jgi:hypothetical protein
MARKDKVLDVLALSTLPERAKIARLASRYVGKPFPMEQAHAVIKCYFEQRGRTAELTDALYAEKLRQEKLRNERAALSSAAEKRAESPMDRFKASKVGQHKARLNREARRLELAKQAFGDAVRENFNEDTLALMSLISGEDTSYRVVWREASFHPVLSATIEVITMKKQGGPRHARFLLYRTNGRVMVARTRSIGLKEAWGGQLPDTLVAAAAALQKQGCTFQTDLEGQEMVVLNADGSELRRVPWTGRTVDE